MKSFELISIFPAGSVMVGGYSAAPAGMHGAHAVGRDGRPLIPATALRGALREALESVLRGIGQAVCSGGDGVDPEMSPRDGSTKPCTLDNGKSCPVCRLFGTQRATIESDERAFSALILGDAHLDENQSVHVLGRPGIAVRRNRRSVEDKALFVQRVSATPGARFVAKGLLLDTTLENLFRVALRATTHIGAGRSRGLARVNFEVRDLVEESPKASLGSATKIRIRATLLRPASIGVPVIHPNQLSETRREIPGAALRGAIGFALAAHLPNPNSDQAFQDLVHEKEGARFGFLYPVDVPGDSAMGPRPITAMQCKNHKTKHPIVDTLLDRLAIALLTDPQRIAEDKRIEACKHCKALLRAVGGSRSRFEDIPTRTITRAALDRTQSSTRNEMLYSQELLEAGTIFEGIIEHIPANSRQTLEEASNLPIYLGRGRSAGWGHAKIELLELPRGVDLKKRANAFHDACKKKFPWKDDRAKSLVSVTLQSPLICSDDDDGEKLLVDFLDAKQCVFKARRFSREGGWDQREKGMQGAMAVAAGAVFVLDVGRPWTEKSKQIQELENEGLGERRHQGYGRVLAFDPFHTKDADVRRESMKNEQEIDPFRKNLVLAAESVAEMLAATKIEKTQLNHLIAVCGEATCAEEIRNYVRYQAGRKVWPKDAADTVVRSIDGVLKNVASDNDALRVQAWRLYAVFLTRAFTYHRAA